MRKIVDNKAELNMVLGMLAISRFVESFNSDKFWRMYVETVNLIYPQNQKSIGVR